MKALVLLMVSVIAWWIASVSAQSPSPEEILHAELDAAIVDVWGVRGLITQVGIYPLGLGTLATAGHDERFCGVTFDDDVFAWTEAKRSAVVIHEAGHCIGLTHNSDPASVMYESYPPAGPCPIASDRILAKQIRDARLLYRTTLGGIAR